MDELKKQLRQEKEKEPEINIEDIIPIKTKMNSKNVEDHEFKEDK